MTLRAAEIEGLDPECATLVDALNGLPGVRTTESCCGHGKAPFVMFFHCDSWESLQRIAAVVEDQRADEDDSILLWQIVVGVRGDGSGVLFLLESNREGSGDRLALALTE